MQLGMIGLGRMGANMVRRLMRNSHECVVYDHSADAVKQLAGEGAIGASSLDEFTGKLQTPKVVWLMLPAAAVDASLKELLDLTAIALAEDPALAQFAGRVSDSGEGRWTVLAAVDEGAPVPVLSSALYGRFASRGETDFADKLLSAMRFQFGGHHELPSK